jgi:hypothetical protein
MTLKRFEALKRFLHFNDNAETPEKNSPDYDRAYKIRPVTEHLNAAFQKARTPDECQSVDERMVKFKGHNIMRQYVKGKPVKWGFKLWMRCGSQSDIRIRWKCRLVRKLVLKLVSERTLC